VSSARAARLLFQLPQQSRIFKRLQPANQWGWNEVLLNNIGYLLNILAWQNTKDAAKKVPQKAPKQFVPEFMRDMEKERAINKDIAVHDIDDIKKMLAKPRK